MMGHIRISSIRVDLPIYHGVADGVLSKGVGHLPESSFPIGREGDRAVHSGHLYSLRCELPPPAVMSVLTVSALPGRQISPWRILRVISLTVFGGLLLKRHLDGSGKPAYNGKYLKQEKERWLMIQKSSPRGLLTGNMLKIIGALAMLADHVGLMFFPDVEAFRIVGRLALPIFAYMIAEGCQYTKNRLRYFLQIFLLAALCQLVYFLVDGSLYMSILVTFSCSVLVIFPLQQWKEAGEGKLLWALVFAGAVAAVYLLNELLTVDYGFWGCMLPVFPSLFRERGTGPRKRMDKPVIHVLMLALGLLVLSLDLGGNQIWSLAAVPLLLLYSGKRGKLPMKYFFYIFYPLHLAILQLISWLI